jgi:molecular chaperone HscB
MEWMQNPFSPKGSHFHLQEEYQLAQTQSSYLNKAYNTLKEPLARAQYMLALNGVEVSESESLEDPELLMEVMEIREEMEEAESEEDIERLKIENTGRYMS